jgi:hypothetical protein
VFGATFWTLHLQQYQCHRHRWIVTYLTTPYQLRCDRVLLKKPIIAKIFKIFPALLGSPRFTTIIRRARHWTYNYLPYFFKIPFNIIMSRQALVPTQPPIQ